MSMLSGLAGKLKARMGGSKVRAVPLNASPMQEASAQAQEMSGKIARGSVPTAPKTGAMGGFMGGVVNQQLGVNPKDVIRKAMLKRFAGMRSPAGAGVNGGMMGINRMM